LELQVSNHQETNKRKSNEKEESEDLEENLEMNSENSERELENATADTMASTSNMKLIPNSGLIYVWIISIGALGLAFYYNTLAGHLQFMPTFAQLIPLKLSASDASSVMKVFSLFFVLGRVIAVYASIKITAKTMI